MEFIDHTLAWCRGEIFEGRVLALWGFVILVVAIIYWQLGTTPAARAMLLPLLLVGGLSMVVGVSMNFTNQNRITAYQAAHEENPTAFVKSEKERTEAFIQWYPYTMFSFAAVIIAGLGLFLFLPTPVGRAWGLGLILLGMSVLFLDHFSEERAGRYHAQIMQQLG